MRHEFFWNIVEEIRRRKGMIKSAMTDREICGCFLLWIDDISYSTQCSEPVYSVLPSGKLNSTEDYL